MDTISLFIKYEDIVPNIVKHYSKNKDTLEDLTMQGYLVLLEFLNSNKAKEIYNQNPDKMKNYISVRVKYGIITYLEKEKYGLYLTNKDRKILKNVKNCDTKGIKSKDFDMYNHLFWMINGGSVSLDDRDGEDLKENYLSYSDKYNDLFSIINNVLNNVNENKRNIYKEWIETVLNKKYSINEASNKLNISRQYFSRIVKEINNMIIDKYNNEK